MFTAQLLMLCNNRTSSFAWLMNRKDDISYEFNNIWNKLVNGMLWYTKNIVVDVFLTLSSELTKRINERKSATLYYYHINYSQVYSLESSALWFTNIFILRYQVWLMCFTYLIKKYSTSPANILFSLFILHYNTL